MEAEPVGRERLRMAEERDIVDRDDERRRRGRHREAGRMAHVDAQVDAVPPVTVPDLVAPARCARSEAAELHRAPETRVQCTPGAPRAGRERDHVGMARQFTAQHLRHPPDTAGDALEELADVDADPQSRPAIGIGQSMHDLMTLHDVQTFQERRRDPRLSKFAADSDFPHTAVACREDPAARRVRLR